MPLQIIPCTSNCSIIMTYIHRFPCPLLSRWVQPIGSTSRRSQKEKVRECVGDNLFSLVGPCWVMLGWLHPTTTSHINRQAVFYTQPLLSPKFQASLPLLILSSTLGNNKLLLSRRYYGYVAISLYSTHIPLL